VTAPLRLCLAGSSVSGSPSAAMHTAALRASRIEGSYVLRDLSPAELPGFVAELRSGAYRGCNVTIPYKAALAAACDQLVGDAELLGAVNTITVESGRLVGDNTDADGFELGLSVQRLWPRPGGAALVIGAGGAAAAVVLALSRAPVSSVGIVARRPPAAAALAARMSAFVPVAVLPWDHRALRNRLGVPSIVVNATPAGLADLPLRPQDLPASCTVADVRYRPGPIEFVAAARATGHPAGDGLEMLLQQGMLSFTRWTGAPPPWAAARAGLLAALDL